MIAFGGIGPKRHIISPVIVYSGAAASHTKVDFKFIQRLLQNVPKIDGELTDGFEDHDGKYHRVTKMLSSLL